MREAVRLFWGDQLAERDRLAGLLREPQREPEGGEA